jgi:uncharacterized cupin superfamily protein
MRPIIAAVVPESELEQTESGLVPAREGWFVVNGREARWVHSDGRGFRLPLTGWGGDEHLFPQVGLNVFVLGPGEPMGMYHFEHDQEDFLVIAGEALLLVEGQERRLQAWDFVHCPPGTNHSMVGAGDGRCVIVAVGGRAHEEEWGAYTVDETAQRHGVGVENETSDPGVAYRRFGPPRPVPYEEGLLPGA